MAASASLNTDASRPRSRMVTHTTDDFDLYCRLPATVLEHCRREARARQLCSRDGFDSDAGRRRADATRGLDIDGRILMHFFARLITFSKPGDKLSAAARHRFHWLPVPAFLYSESQL